MLLRPRTPLKDMYLELDPGTKNAGRSRRRHAGGRRDQSGRRLLRDPRLARHRHARLPAAAARRRRAGVPGTRQSRPAPSPPACPTSGHLQAVRAAEPRHGAYSRAARRAHAEHPARRSTDCARSREALGSVQGPLTSLINSSNTNFQAIASQAQQVEEALTLLPGTLQQSITTYNKLRPFAVASEQSSRALIPWAHALAPALIALAAAVQADDAGDPEPAEAVHAAGEARRSDPRAGGEGAVGGDPAARALDRRVEHAVQHARLPAGGREQGYCSGARGSAT